MKLSHIRAYLVERDCFLLITKTGWEYTASIKYTLLSSGDSKDKTFSAGDLLHALTGLDSICFLEVGHKEDGAEEAPFDSTVPFQGFFSARGAEISVYHDDHDEVFVCEASSPMRSSRVVESGKSMCDVLWKAIVRDKETVPF